MTRIPLPCAFTMPPRRAFPIMGAAPAAPNAVAAELLPMDPAARQGAILAAVTSGRVPSWISDASLWRPVRIAEGGHELVLTASPDYFAVGGDDAPFRMPMLPATAQSIADFYGAILPSRKIVNAIARAAGARIDPQPLGPARTGEDRAAFLESNAKIEAQLAKIGASPARALIVGGKKDIVVGPALDGSHVAIYGWHKPDGTFWQPYQPVAHPSSYEDYSHGVRLVKRVAMLDGRPVDLASVFLDPALALLVSDQGIFVPRFPSVGLTATPPPAIPGGAGAPVAAAAASGGSIGLPEIAGGLLLALGAWWIL